MTPCARRMRVYAFGTLGVLCAAVCSATSSLWVALVFVCAAIACLGWAMHVERGQ